MKVLSFLKFMTILLCSCLCFCACKDGVSSKNSVSNSQQESVQTPADDEVEDDGDIVEEPKDETPVVHSIELKGEGCTVSVGDEKNAVVDGESVEVFVSCFAEATSPYFTPYSFFAASKAAAAASFLA